MAARSGWEPSPLQASAERTAQALALFARGLAENKDNKAIMALQEALSTRGPLGNAALVVNLEGYSVASLLVGRFPDTSDLRAELRICPTARAAAPGGRWRASRPKVVTAASPSASGTSPT